MQLLIGTGSGLFTMVGNTQPRPLDGPPDVAYLAVAPGARYALTGTGALWRAEGDGAWKQVSERAVPDEPWTLAADPRLPGRLYIGVSPALLYRSDDGGEHWTACDSVRHIPGYERWTFPPPPHIPHVRSIAPDPQQAGGLFIGVEEGGVYRSPDGGETWESLNEGLYWDVHNVAAAPDGVRLYATTGNGFHRSDDRGRTWTRLMGGLGRTYTVPIAVSPRTVGRIVVAAAAGPPPTWSRGADAALYRSDDGGEHWQQLDGGLPERFPAMVTALTEDGEGRLYAAARGELYAGEDEGERWRLLTADLPNVRALALA